MSKTGNESIEARAVEVPREAVSPESLLKRLEERIVVARDEKERRDFSRLADELRRELSKRKEEAVDATTDVVADLKSRMSPEQNARLREVERGMGTAFEKTKAGASAIREKAGDAAAQAAEKISGSEVARAIRSGDAQKAVSQMAQKAEFASKAAMIVSNVEQMANEIEEQLPFFGTIIAAIMRFFAGLARGLVPKADKEKLDAAKRAAESTAQKAKSAMEQTVDHLSGIDREKARSEAIAQTKRYVEEKFFHGYELTEWRRKAFIEAMESHQFPGEAIAEIAEKFAKGEKVSAAEANGIIEKYVFSNSIIVLKLALAGVIPLHKLAVAVVDESADTAGRHFALTLGSLGIEPSYFGFEDLQKIADQYKDDPEKRASMLYFLYKPASVFASVAGGMAGSLLSAGIGFATKTTVDSLKMGKDVLVGHATGNYAPIVKHFEALENALRVEPKYSPKLLEIERLTVTVRNNYVLLQALEDEAKIPGSLKANPQVRGLLSSEALKEFDSIKTEAGYREFLRRQMTSAPVLSQMEALKNWANKIGGTASGRIVEHVEKLRGVLDVQTRLAAREASALKWVAAMKDISKYATISRVQDTTMLMVRDEQTMRQMAPALSKLGAEGLKHFFNGMPLIGLGMGTYDLTRDPEKHRSLLEWGKMIGAAVSMPFAGYVLLGEVKISKDGVENVEKGLLGATLLTASGVYMLKNPRSAFQFATGITTIKQASETVAAGVRGARVVGRIAPKLGEALAKAWAEGLRLPGKAKFAGLAFSLAAALALYASSDGNPYETALKEGLVDPETGKMTPKGWTKFDAQTPEGKKAVLDAAISERMRSVGASEAETSYEPGSYNILAKTEAEAKRIQGAVGSVIDDVAKHVGFFEIPVISKKEA